MMDRKAARSTGGDARPSAPAPAGPGFLAALALLASSCAGNLRWPYIRTQRYPAPMPALVEPLPPGTESLYPPGPEEVLVVRHADPVQLRPAGQRSAFPMAFYEKARRVHSGSWVYGSPGGRAEVIWPNGSNLIVFGRCAAVIGSQSRGEPSVIFYEIERADLKLVERDQVRLVGGSVLAAESGPFVIERLHGDVLRVKNQSKKAGDLSFREARFRLEPGQEIELPLLDAGGEPLAEPLGATTVAGPGYQVEVVGEAEVVEADSKVRVRATGEHRIDGLGVRMELLPGEEVTFLDLRREPSEALRREPLEGLAPSAPAGEVAPPETAPETAPHVVPETAPGIVPEPSTGPASPPAPEGAVDPTSIPPAGTPAPEATGEPAPVAPEGAPPAPAEEPAPEGGAELPPGPVERTGAHTPEAPGGGSG